MNMWLVGVDMAYYPTIETFAFEEQANQRYLELVAMYKGDFIASIYLCQVLESSHG